MLGGFGNNVMVLSADRRLMVMDEMTGEASYSVPMTGMSLFVPNASRPAIYVASTDGKVACIRQAKAGLLKGQMLMEAASPPAGSQPAAPPGPRRAGSPASAALPP